MTSPRSSIYPFERARQPCLIFYVLQSHHSQVAEGPAPNSVPHGGCEKQEARPPGVQGAARGGRVSLFLTSTMPEERKRTRRFPYFFLFLVVEPQPKRRPACLRAFSRPPSAASSGSRGQSRTSQNRGKKSWNAAPLPASPPAASARPCPSLAAYDRKRHALGEAMTWYSLLGVGFIRTVLP